MFFLETKGVIGVQDITNSNAIQAVDYDPINNADSVSPYIDGGLHDNNGPTSNQDYDSSEKPAYTLPATDEPNDIPVKPQTSAREFVESLLENAVDRQNDILDGLSDVIKDTFNILKQREQNGTKSDDNTQFSKVMEKQEELIVLQNKRLDKQDVAIATMSNILEKVTQTHDMMADSKFHYIFY